METKIINLLNACNVGNRTGWTVIAIAFNHNKIIEYAVSSTCPHVHFPCRRIQVPSTHAEIMLIRKLILKCHKAGKKKRLSLNMIVARINSTGYCCAKPCHHCSEFIKSNYVMSYMKIKRIYYFVDKTLMSSKQDDLENDHISYGWKTYRES